MTSAHWLFIPAVLLVGLVVGWVLGARAARDAQAAADAKRARIENRKG